MYGATSLHLPVFRNRNFPSRLSSIGRTLAVEALAEGAATATAARAPCKTRRAATGAQQLAEAATPESRAPSRRQTDCIFADNARRCRTSVVCTRHARSTAVRCWGDCSSNCRSICRSATLFIRNSFALQNCPAVPAAPDGHGVMLLATQFTISIHDLDTRRPRLGRAGKNRSGSSVDRGVNSSRAGPSPPCRRLW